MQTYIETIYNTGDIVSYKRKNYLSWKKPESALRRDGLQILVNQVKLN